MATTAGAPTSEHVLPEVASASPGSDGLEEGKRRAYLVGLTLGMPIIVTVWWVQRQIEPLVTLVYPLLGLVVAVLGLGLLTRRVATRTAERALLLVLPALYFVRLGVLLYLDGDAVTIRAVVSDSIAPGIAITVLLLYLAYEPRMGLRLSIGVLGTFGLLLTPWLVLAIRAGEGTAAFAVIRHGVYALVVALLAYVLTSLKTRFAEQRAHAAALEHLASTDPLTGAANRRRFQEALDRAVADAERYDRGFAVVQLDLDGFKALNDRAGHAAGDAALCRIVAALGAELRVTDLLARWGGDELVVLIAEAHPGSAARSAQRWREVIRELGLGSDAVPITASIGVAAWHPGDTADGLLSRADAAMYRAKLGGRDRVVAVDVAGSPVEPAGP